MLAVLQILCNFLCRKTRPNKERKCPIVLRIQYRKERWDIYTGLYCSTAHWDAAHDQVTRAEPAAYSINKNLQNGVVEQISPDGGKSTFYYDRLGRLAVSQNAQQFADDKFSYTRYDALGRIVEVGQKPHTTAISQAISQHPINLENWITTNTSGGGTREQLTITGYDLPYGIELFENGVTGNEGWVTQRNLRNRVSFSMVKNLATDDYHSATFYTYDIHGNVDTLLQAYPGITEIAENGHEFKLIAYRYDLVSGKVTAVDYHPRGEDRFFHRYVYDSENRLMEVLTSRDSISWERDAKYSYYDHGPLARVEQPLLVFQ